MKWTSLGRALGLVALLPPIVRGSDEVRGGGLRPSDLAKSWDHESDISPEGAAQAPDRALMMEMEAYGELSCNADAAIPIESQACLDAALPFSSLVEALGPDDDVLTVPCGECYAVDYASGETVTLPPGGLEVLGRLHFPPSADVVLNATGIVIQGYLDAPRPLDPGKKAIVTLYGTDSIFFYPHETCGGLPRDAISCPERKDVGKKAIAVAGGKVNIQAREETCISWTKLIDADAAGKTFTVDPDFAKCVKVGHEVVFASEERSSTAHDVGVVEGVDSTAGTITLTEPIVRAHGFATETVLSPAESDLAVEVANLNRDVIFTSQSDDVDDPTHGGHFIVFHTPAPQNQVIRGVEFNGMGQDGNLGRYPLHFHMSGDASDSVVSGNVVRGSSQRCYVVHDTHNVVVRDNVAFDTKGHCYITESGAEEGNSFVENLSILNGHKMNPIGQSDDPQARQQTASYWIRSMKNDFVGNAAGGGDIGFWIEMLDKGGNQDGHLFQANSAHSSFQGLNFYRQGWKPTSPGLIDGMKTYKNDEGIKCHFSGNFNISNSFVAENEIGFRHGVGNKGVIVYNTIFLGYTDDSESRKGHTGGHFAVGVRPSFNTGLYNGDKAITFTDVAFAKYDNAEQVIIGMYYDSREGNLNMGRSIKMTGTSLDRVTDSAKPSIGCASNNHLEDIDGVLGPEGKGPGFIINDNEDTKAFLDGCTAISGSCSSFCEHACLRMVSIKPGHSSVEGMELTSAESGTGYLFTSGDYATGFTIVLPKMEYRVKFFDGYGQHVPNVMGAVTLFDKPICHDYVTETDFAFQGIAWDDDNPYEVMETATDGCPSGTSITTAEECSLAGESLGLFFRGGSLITGSWGFVPCGCAIMALGDMAIHFDANLNDCASDGSWRPVCKRLRFVSDFPTKAPSLRPTNPTVSPSFSPTAGPPAYEVLEVTTGCPSGRGIATTEECRLAGESLSLYFRNDYLITGTWWFVPCGCAVMAVGDMAVHFDTNLNDCGSDGNWHSICKTTGTAVPTVSPSLNPTPGAPLYEVMDVSTEGCPPGRGITTTQECKAAGESLSLYFRSGYLISGTWWFVPCGCAMQAVGDMAVHFDSNLNECGSDGNWRSICKTTGTAPPTISPNLNGPQYEVLEVSTEGCPAGKGITTVDECRVAGESLSLYFRSGYIPTGTWWFVPCGCSIQAGGDMAVHFDTNLNDCGSDGNWRSVCKI